MKEARWYTAMADGSVQCALCAHRCLIKEGAVGVCGVRQNKSGVLYTYTYGKPIAMHVDPIEKKPLYHFFPCSRTFSLATIGCNFRCGFCQNWEISQAKIDGARDASGQEVAPEDLVRMAQKQRCASISCTYTEPTIFGEYALDTARIAREKGLRNIFVTNGFMTEEYLTQVTPFLDAANVDYKFYNDAKYRTVCNGARGPVENSIRTMKDRGVWVEVTTLLVPGENDDEEQLSGIAEFIAGIDRDMPWHISRFHPDFEYGDLPPTPDASLERALDIARAAGIRYVYLGNVQGWGNDTFCTGCGEALIRREGVEVIDSALHQGACSNCSQPLPGVFEDA
jgi:pyruvate formate lyase activating enzyme